MEREYTAIVEQEGDWWLGWIAPKNANTSRPKLGYDGLRCIVCLINKGWVKFLHPSEPPYTRRCFPPKILRQNAQPCH